MATNRERLYFLGQQLKDGHYADILRLMARKLGLTSDEPSVGPQPVSHFHAQKQQAIESFLDFIVGGEQPRWPLEVFIEVSNLCDLQCAMCHTFSALNPIDNVF